MRSDLDYKLNLAILVGSAALFGLIILLALLSGNENQKKLKANYRHTKAKIVEFEKAIYKTSSPTKFAFNANDKRVLGQLKSGVFCKVLEDNDKEALRKIEFDIVYYPHNPIISQLLYNKELYETYNVEYPDQDSELYQTFETYFNCKWTLWRWMN